MNYVAFLNQMEVIMEMSPDTLNGSEKLASLEGWDSLAVLGLQVWVDSTLKRPLDVPALISAVTLEDVWKIITK